MKPWVLVTGGAKRLGYEICLAFAKSGWNIVCHYSQSEDAAIQLGRDIQACNVKFIPIQGKLNGALDAQNLFSLTLKSIQQADEGFGEQQESHLVCIVNNASQFQPDENSESSFMAQLGTNFIVPVALAKLLAMEHKTSSSNPNVIHILDQKILNLNPDYSDYTLSKLALERAVTQQAQALAPSIRVNGIAPGLIYPSGPQTQDNFDKASTINALRRKIDPVKVAETAVFLAGNPCVTGQMIAVDNGQHLVPLARDILFVTEAFLSGVKHD